MYSGTTFRTKSGRVGGAHQKIDRVARRHMADFLDRKLSFPTAQQIVHFEGLNGPDGIKRKSPGKDEPWHFIDPKNPDGRLLESIHQHTANLTSSLVTKNTARSAFEAAWLAHSVTDGLTPAHHEAFEDKLAEIRGEDMETRNSLRKKIVMPGGGSTKQFIKNNWEFWGARGMMSTHMLFEIGIATTIKPLKFDSSKPSSNDLIRLRQEGFDKLFFEALHDIASLDMYELFKKSGWTRHMAQLTKSKLVPIIIRTVTLAWYDSYAQAVEKVKRANRD